MHNKKPLPQRQVFRAHQRGEFNAAISRASKQSGSILTVPELAAVPTAARSVMASTFADETPQNRAGLAICYAQAIADVLNTLGNADALEGLHKSTVADITSLQRLLLDEAQAAITRVST